uniref:Uncharacterized protein n=1 Tax=viral metagenome TaxID=1070528 RepID=A0A6C0LR74_9ZZZZ
MPSKINIIIIVIILIIYIGPIVLDYYLEYNVRVQEFNSQYHKTECKVLSTNIVINNCFEHDNKILKCYSGYIYIKYTLINTSCVNNILLAYSNKSLEDNVEKQLLYMFPINSSFSCFYRKSDINIVGTNYVTNILYDPTGMEPYLFFIILYGLLSPLYLFVICLCYYTCKQMCCKNDEIIY